MKIVNTGIKYQIYDDSLRTFDSLPAATYCVRFSKLSGFYLESRPICRSTKLSMARMNPRSKKS